MPLPSFCINNKQVLFSQPPGRIRIWLRLPWAVTFEVKLPPSIVSSYKTLTSSLNLKLEKRTGSSGGSINKAGHPPQQALRKPICAHIHCSPGFLLWVSAGELATSCTGPKGRSPGTASLPLLQKSSPTSCHQETSMLFTPYTELPYGTTD